MSVETTFILSGISALPYVVALGAALIPLYVIRKDALLGAAWKDCLLWIGSLILFYFLSVANMYLPWPSVLPESLALAKAKADAVALAEKAKADALALAAAGLK